MTADAKPNRSTIVLEHCQHAYAAAQEDVHRELDSLALALLSRSVGDLHRSNDLRRTMRHVDEALAALDRSRAALDAVKQVAP